jgi:hypothetical protein
MMTHIPHHMLLPQDKVWVRDEGCAADPEKGVEAVAPNESIWHAQDARHAMATHPERYKPFAKGGPLGEPADVVTGGGNVIIESTEPSDPRVAPERLDPDGWSKPAAPAPVDPPKPTPRPFVRPEPPSAANENEFDP